MIGRVRRKFILWAMVAMISIVAVLVAAVNLVNWYQTDRRLDLVLQEISDSAQDKMSERESGASNGAEAETGGKFWQQETESDKQGTNPGKQGKENMKSGNGRHSALIQYGSRYFLVMADEQGQVTEIRQQQELITQEEAQQLLQEVSSQNSLSGYLNEYKYTVKYNSQNQPFYYFLDCSTDVDALQSLLLISILVGVGGILLAFLFILRMSRIAVEPVRISIENQKQFITNAGHELKTPLTAISANMEILSMDLGENEWVDGTRTQVRRMRQLVENMTALSKMEEEDILPEMQYFSLSELASDCTDAFAGVAMVRGRELKDEIQPGITVQGDPSMVQQLLTILCDNAMKYSTDEEPVCLHLYEKGKYAFFETINSWEQNVDPQKLEHLFDRFYRGDASRSTGEKGGHGLGLSIAQAIAERNHALLTVETDAEGRIIFRARFRLIRKDKEASQEAERV